MRSELWSRPEQYSLTEHQQGLISSLSPEEDTRIVGDIGAGKTFAVRHFLREKDINFRYFTASELYRKNHNIGDEVDDTIDVVVVDNFDVIPEQRSYLEAIHETVELELAAFDRSIWLILPSWYQNDWFDTVIENMLCIELDRSQINRLTIDHVVKNLNKLHDGREVSLDLSAPSVAYGYHTIVQTFEEIVE
ncbi:hypothetical protein [Halovenus halobia]|uniref:hypothetical protein n=1 Tax=Halovenus halobia TaxID=3396622 RepID=UPI003F54DB63